MISRRASAVLGLTTLGTAMVVTAGTAAAATKPVSHWRVTVLPVAPQQPVSFSEPGVAGGDNGVVVVNASTANSGAPPTFWLSRDNGLTWAPGRDVAGVASTGDADAAVASDGYVYALNLGYGSSPPAQPSNPTVLVYRSPDGRAWLGPASFPPPHGLDQPDRPWLAIPPGHPRDVDVFNSEVGGNIVVWRSGDRAATFAGPIPVTGGANSEAALTLGSRPLFDPADDARMYLFYETATPAGVPLGGPGSNGLYEFPLTQLWLATSADSGQTWSNRRVLDVTTAFGSTGGTGSLAHLLAASAIDGSGNLYVALSVRTGTSTQTHVYVISSTDQGATWSGPTRIESGTASNVMPAMAARRDGKLFLSWYGSSAPDFRDPHAAWTEMFAQSANPLTAHPTYDVETVGGPDPVHVGGVDTAGAIGSDLGANWGLRDFQSITVDSCGHPHLAWAVDAGGDRTVTASTAAVCPVVATSVPVQAAPSTGSSPDTGAAPVGSATAPAVYALGATALLTARRRRRRRARNATTAVPTRVTAGSAAPAPPPTAPVLGLPLKVALGGAAAASADVEMTPQGSVVGAGPAGLPTLTEAW